MQRVVCKSTPCGLGRVEAPFCPELLQRLRDLEETTHRQVRCSALQCMGFSLDALGISFVHRGSDCRYSDRTILYENLDDVRQQVLVATKPLESRRAFEGRPTEAAGNSFSTAA